jgi:hypothetical protein
MVLRCGRRRRKRRDALLHSRRQADQSEQRVHEQLTIGELLDLAVQARNAQSSTPLERSGQERLDCLDPYRSTQRIQERARQGAFRVLGERA